MTALGVVATIACAMAFCVGAIVGACAASWLCSDDIQEPDL
jgi:hypothetical protein